MGLSSSPFVFSKISDFVVRCLIREGFLECINYLDDFCIIERTQERCSEGQWTLVQILRRLGFYINYKKLLQPATKVRFLGIDVDTVEMQLTLPMDKLEKLKVQLRQFLGRRKATKRELERLAGILAHCCKVIHGGRTFSRRVYDLINSVSKPNFKIRLNSEFRLDLNWWLEFASQFNGRAKVIKSANPVLAVYSDSSLFGFGALHGSDWLAGTFKKSRGLEFQNWLGHHFEKAEEAGCGENNINVLEMWPILLAVRKWGSDWSNRTIIFVTDNTQVRAALNSGRSKNKFTMGWLRDIFWQSIKYNFDVQSVYINTRDNIICDSLSRLDKFVSIARIRDADSSQYLCCHSNFCC